jgi:hypothetical protein
MSSNHHQELLSDPEYGLPSFRRTGHGYYEARIGQELNGSLRFVDHKYTIGDGDYSQEPR